jgi:hypothetical protein
MSICFRSLKGERNIGLSLPGGDRSLCGCDRDFLAMDEPGNLHLERSDRGALDGVCRQTHANLPYEQSALVMMVAG